MKQFHWFLCVAKNCDWSRKIAPLSNLTRASLLIEWKLTAKAELNCEIYKSWRKCWKNQVSFCHRSSSVSGKAWMLPWKWQELKKHPRKTCGYGQRRDQLIEFWMKGAEMTVGIFVFYGWRFSNQLDILSETHFSCDTVDRGLWLAILSSLLCPETDRNIHIGKQGYVSFFTVLKKWCFIPDINQRFSSCFDTSKSWILLNKLISQTFCLLGLLNSRQSNGSRLTKTKFVPRGLVQLD